MAKELSFLLSVMPTKQFPFCVSTDSEKEILPGSHIKVCCGCYTKFFHPSDSVT